MAPSVSAIFSELDSKIKADPSLQKKINGTYLFKVGNDAYFVDLKSGKGVSKGEQKADCTVTMKEGDFVDLMTGKLNGQSAFMGGKLKVAGNMGLAMKLGQLSQSGAKL